MSSPRSLWLENPILARELRTRMRGSRAFWLLFGYVAILAAILFITYLAWWNSVQGDLTNGGGAAGGAAQVGKIFYSTLFTVQALMIGIITPSLTAGGISIEKEQRTFDLLTVSLMPRRSIVIGKLVSALAFVALLLTASLPLVSLSFLLGGVSPAEVLSAYGLLLVTAFLYGSMGMACSSVAKNTTTSTVMTTGAIIVLFVATLPLSLVALTGSIGAPALSNPNGIGLSALNPIGALTAGTITETYFGVSVPAWFTALVINGLFGTILTLVAIHRLDYPRTDRSGWLRLLTALLVGLLAFCVYGMFARGSGFAGNVSTQFGIAVFVTLLGLIPLVPLFATADGLPERGGVSGVFNPFRLGRGEAPSGVLYVIALAVLCAVVLSVGTASAPVATPVATPTPGPRGMPPAGPSPGSVTPLNIAVGTVADLLLLSVAVAWGFGCFGVFCSALTRNRWSALGLVAGVMVIAYLIPFTAVAARASTTEKATVWDNLLYLSPLSGGLAIVAQATSDKTSDFRTWAGDALFFSNVPPAYVISMLYFVLGAAFLVAAHLVHARHEARRAVARAAAEENP
jgi:ABC-type transport system involved in multi-copper enzyme maturation permease subunit